MIDSIYTDPSALRKLYRSPRNPLREAEQVDQPPMAGGSPEPVVNQPPANPTVLPFTGDGGTGGGSRGGIIGPTGDPIGDLTITV